MRDDKSAWSQNLIVVKVLINPQAHSVARSIAKSVLGVFYPELSGGDFDESRAEDDLSKTIKPVTRGGKPYSVTFGRP